MAERILPRNGVNRYFDTDLVLWVSRDINRAQFDTLAESVRWDLDVSTERWPNDVLPGMPKPSDIAVRPGGRIIVVAGEHLTYEQLREFARVARKHVKCDLDIEWEQP